MLKNISNFISPKLFKILMEMGHGDELIIADGNFPGYSLADKLVPYYGVSIKIILEEILKYFPLDDFDDYNTILMREPQNESGIPNIWKEYKKVFEEKKANPNIKILKRKSFYLRAKKSYAIIVTNDDTPYANLILKKGVIDSVIEL